MKDIDFMTENKYIYLPTKKNSKVALAIDNIKISENSFELYNPFSKKAVLLKKTLKFLCIKINLFIIFFSFKKKDSSKFIEYLENKLKQKIITSLYYATAKDKIVLQVQSFDGEILGYLKYPISVQGSKNIKREIKAYKNLSKIGITDKYIFKDKYNKQPFIFLTKVEGDIKELESNDVKKILGYFYKEKKLKLSEHPRIKKLKKQLVKYELFIYSEILDKLIQQSNFEYYVCFEHGDFTPWNIIEDKNSFVPFDFEYFIKNGIEYFDLIKYYYQIGTLLRNYNKDTLLKYIFDKLDALNTNEKEIIFEIYLIKEIILKIKENHDFQFEKNLLYKLEKK